MNELYFLEVNKAMYTTEALEKLEEEREELVEALLNNDPENTVEEAWDVIQTVLAVISSRGLEEEFREGLFKHNTKLMSRGHKIY